MDKELFSLLLITFLAVMVPILASRMRFVRLPIVVGEILAGIIIGKSGFDLVTHTPALDFIAEFGFIFLMFLSGLELNLTELRDVSGEEHKPARWRGPVALVCESFLLTLGLAAAVGFAMVHWGLTKNGLLLGLILSTTSLGIVVPVLKERGMTDTSYGQVLLMGALIGDFATLLLLSLSIALIRRGPSFELMFFLFLLAGFAVTVRLGQRVRKSRILTRTVEELSHATAQIRVRGAFALMVAWVFISRNLGIEIILGAFLAGTFISLTAGERETPLREKLEAIGYGFFIPIFFINVGAGFDLSSLLASQSALLMVPIMIGAAYLVKVLPALLFRHLFSWRESLAAGFLLSSRLSLIIAAAAIALELELITPAVNSAVILVAVVTCTLSPIIFTKMVQRPVENERKGIIVMGTGQLPIFLGRRLRHFSEQVTFVGVDDNQLAQLKKSGFKVVTGPPNDDGVLEQAGADQAEALVVIPDDPTVGLEVCRTAKIRFQVPKVIALADNPDIVSALKRLGIQVIQSSLSTALAVEGALRFPRSFEMLADMNSGVDLIDGVVTNRALAGRSLRRIRFPGGVLVMGIRRGGEALIPNGTTVLEMGDILILVGNQSALKQARKLVHGR